MTKRIIAVLVVLALAIGCVVALAETTTAEPSAEPTAEVNAEATEEATVEPTATPIPEGKTRYVSAPSGLYIRAAAELDAEIVATPDFNYALKVIGEEGKWSHVIFETNGRVFEGYCWTAYLSDAKTVLKVKTTEAPNTEPEKTRDPEPEQMRDAEAEF